MAATYTIRRAAAEDAETIVRQRRAMFHEMGYREEPVLDAMAVAFRPWLLRMMHSGEYLAWFAVADGGSIAAGLGAVADGLAAAHDRAGSAPRQYPQRLHAAASIAGKAWRAS